ncbi:MAG: hypothetical protein AAFQ53_11325, partial [Bacteroidota bacterium]
MTNTTRRSLLRGAFAAVGFFALARRVPGLEPETQPSTELWTFVGSSNVGSVLAVHGSELHWRPQPNVNF